MNRRDEDPSPPEKGSRKPQAGGGGPDETRDVPQGACAAQVPPPPGAEEKEPQAPRAGGERERTLLGTSVGSIRVVDALGKGGMGEVYVGFDEKLKRKVALKALRGELRLQAQARGRFIHEAHVLGQLEHPHICRIYDLIEGKDEDFLVLELIQGASLKKAIREDLPRTLKLKIARQTAQALEAAHGKGVVHRDLKPDNVMLTPEGDVKVLDFGLSRSWAGQIEPTFGPEEVSTWDSEEGAPAAALAGGSRTYAATRVGSVMGTLGYMSPEQARGESATPASDMYAFGVLLQELFSGEPALEPYASVQEALKRAERGETRDFADPDRDLVALVNRLKSLAPAARPSAVDVVERLDWITQKPRRRRVRILAAAAAAILVASTALAVVQAIRAHREADRARQEAQRAEREAATAKQVSDFLIGMFSESDPAYAKGRTITAREILDQGAKKVEAELKSQPQVQARLLTTIGGVYNELGLYEEAEPLLRKAIAVRKGAGGGDDSEAAESLKYLGVVLWRKGDNTSAKTMLEQALQIHEKVDGPDHRNVSSDLQALGVFYEDIGEFAAARAALERALRIDEKAMGTQDPNLGVDLNNLGSFLHHQGDFEGARPLYERALSIHEKALGPDAPSVATDLNNLGTLLDDKGDFAAAKPLYERALAINEKALGPYHPNVASTLGNLANLYSNQGDFDKALPLGERALQIQEKALGPDHPGVATALTNLAALFYEQGEYEKARPLMERALAIDERALGPDHPEVATDLDNLASLLEEMGKTPESVSLLERSLRIKEKSLGPDHPSVALTLNNLALKFYRQGKDAQAQALFERVLKIDEKALGPEDPTVADDLKKLASTLSEQGRHEEALKLSERSVGILDRRFQKNAGDASCAMELCSALRLLGSMEKSAGDMDKARASWNRAVAVIKPFTTSTENPKAMEAYVRALLLLGRVDEARPVVKTLLDRGWGDSGFLDLCRKNGLAPKGAAKAER